MINNEILQGKWKEIKGEIRTQWGKLTDDELEQTTGNLTSIVGIIQQRYGEKKEEVEAKLASLAAKCNTQAEKLKTVLQS